VITRRISEIGQRKREKMNSLNLKQVKGNFQRLFDKNLTDLVRGLRNNKDNEVNEVRTD
jgi:hypothetical protein